LKLQNPIIGSLSKILPAILIYGLLAAIVLFLGHIQRTGIISTAWVLYVLAWGLFALCGLIFGLLRLLKVFNNTQSQFYIFVAIANFCNSIAGALLYAHPDPTADATVLWLLLGATFILGNLMLFDVFF